MTQKLALLGILTVTMSAAPEQANTITITSAQYGTIIGQPPNGQNSCTQSPATLDLTTQMRAACTGATCAYQVPVPSQAQDPAFGCYKNFAVTYTCGASAKVERRISVGGVLREAAGSIVNLSCENSTGVNIVEATYGATATRVFPAGGGACTVAAGNSTRNLQNLCTGQASCNFAVRASDIGDPAFGCSKNFSAKYYCNSPADVQTVALTAEADGKTLALSCAAGGNGVTLTIEQTTFSASRGLANAFYAFNVSAPAGQRTTRATAIYRELNLPGTNPNPWNYIDAQQLATQRGSLGNVLNPGSGYEIKVKVYLSGGGTYESELVRFTTPSY